MANLRVKTAQSLSAGLAVGAVYDRALAAFECRKRAVIDRAYSLRRT